MRRDCEENHMQKTIGENCFINVYEFVNVISFVGERKHPTNLKMSYKFSCLCYIRSTLRQEDRGLQTKHGYKATKWGCGAIPCLEHKQMRRILPALKASSGRPLQPSDRVRTSEFWARWFCRSVSVRSNSREAGSLLILQHRAGFIADPACGVPRRRFRRARVCSSKVCVSLMTWVIINLVCS